VGALETSKPCPDRANRAWHEPEAVPPRCILLLATGVLVVHGVVPILLAGTGRHQLKPRHSRALAGVRAAGAVPLVGGAGLVAWALAGHYRSAPGGSFAFSLTPEYLLEGDPYRFSRNPMYVGELAIWTGWSMLLGSRRVAAAAVLAGVGARRAIAVEERTLESRFGDAWRRYASRVPRWI
jgi:protein-S-isoprenylcysteine O-methyltransferase Ste14